jgi:hypothetical protein
MMPARSGGTAKMICQNYLDGNCMKLASGLPKSEVYGDCISWMLPAEKSDHQTSLIYRWQQLQLDDEREGSPAIIGSPP